MMTMIKDLVQDALDAVFNEAEDADASQQTGGGEETGPTKEKKKK